MSSNYTAGVPIKKRRYPLIRTPPSESEEQSSQPVANESLQKENSSPSEGSVLSNASVPASSSSLSDANKDSHSLHEEIKGISDAMNVKMVHSNASSSRVKIEEPSLTMQSLSMVDVCGIKKLVPTEKSANATIISAKTELNLSSSETPFSIGKHVSSKQKLESKADPSRVSEITELSLGIKEHHFSGMAGESGERSQIQECGELISLNLSSSKLESSNQCRSNDFELNTGDTNRPTNRSNWDLNTTVDAWANKMVDEALGEVTMGGFNTISGSHDVKPLISSIGMVGDTVTLEGQIHKENESRSTSGAIQPDLSSWNCNSNVNVHLALNSSVSLSNANCSSSVSTVNHEHPSSPASTVNQKLSNSPASVVNQKLSNSPASNVNQKPSSSPLNRSSNMANPSACKTFVPTGNLDKVNIRTIKPEPLDERIQNDFKGKDLLDFGAVKSELVEACKLGALKSSTFSSIKLADCRPVKSEPVHEGIQETLNKKEGTSIHLDKMMIPDEDIRGKTTSFGKSTRLVNLSTSGDVSNRFESCLSGERSQLSREVPQENSESAKPITPDTMSASVGHTTSTSVGNDGDEVNVTGMVDIVIAEDKNVDDLEQPRLKVGVTTPPDSEGNGEGSASDDEKINLSGDMLEEDSYGTDYESDSNRDLGTVMDVEDDGMGEEDFEDGEVREPMVAATMEEPIGEKKESQAFDNGDFDREQIDFVGLPSGDHPTLSYAENKETKMEEASGPNKNNIKKFDETTYDEKVDKVADDKDILQESLAVELPTDEAPTNEAAGKNTEQLFDETPGASQGNLETVQVSEGDVRNTDVVDKNIPGLPKVDVSFNVDNTAKDNNRGGHKSRIINLQTSVSSSPGRTMTIPARSLPTRAGRLPDVALEGDKLCSRGREEIFTDSSHKFSRDRHQFHSSRNPRLNFGCGRGRISRRIDTLRGDWDPERDEFPEFYNGPVEFRAPRHKYGLETDLEFNSYNVGTNGAFAGTDRGRRKPLNDEAPVFHYPPSRRSPGGREGPPGRGHGMVRRIPRNISPSRCIGEEGSGLVGSRHGDKCMSCLLRIDLKSPMRSPDGFRGHPHLPNRRSPPIYGMERMRSSDHSCFPEEMVVRRHGSPYLSRQSNEMRYIDSGRDLGQPNPPLNRSPSGRVLFRNTRRFDMIDPRERTDNDDYFGRPMPMHSGRYQEIGADGPSDERRRFTERRGPVRHFRPPYNGADGGNFHLNAENGPRPYRLCPENDSEFHDRGNLREREFDRRIKNRTRNVPRRTRNIEEQKGNYGHGGPVWHDSAFDDMPGIKRRRF